MILDKNNRNNSVSLEKVAIIPARGNSKGIKRKNLYPVAGKPLLFYTMKCALDCQKFDKIVVSSEDEEVLSFAMKMGVYTYKRPVELSNDNVHAIHVVLDYIIKEELASNFIVTMLLPTSPLRRAEDIVKAFEIFNTKKADSLVSVYRNSKHIMNFRFIDDHGHLRPFLNGELNFQRQDAESLYVVNGSIYISTVEALMKYRSYHAGMVVPYIMPKERSLDINSLEDIEEVRRSIKT